jgi:hypothetical protein
MVTKRLSDEEKIKRFFARLNRSSELDTSVYNEIIRVYTSGTAHKPAETISCAGKPEPESTDGMTNEYRIQVHGSGWKKQPTRQPCDQCEHKKRKDELEMVRKVNIGGVLNLTSIGKYTFYKPYPFKIEYDPINNMYHCFDNIGGINAYAHAISELLVRMEYQIDRTVSGFIDFDDKMLCEESITLKNNFMEYVDFGDYTRYKQLEKFDLFE